MAESSPIFCTFAERMKNYRIEVTEVLCRIVETQVDSEAEAVETVRQMYRRCVIVLNDSDYVRTEIDVKR